MPPGRHPLVPTVRLRKRIELEKPRPARGHQGLQEHLASFVLGYVGLVIIGLLTILVTPEQAVAQVSIGQAGSEVIDDFKYAIDNAQLDVEDILTSPLHIADPDSALLSPKFYLVLGAAGALWGGSFALDQTMRSHLRSMSSSDADLLEDISYGSVGAGTALLYGYGIYEGDTPARNYALTGGMGAGMATLLNLGIKPAFGRLRPYQNSSHRAFFDGGQSFVSGDVTPLFGLAAGLSEYYDNKWYVAAPVYSLALLDGFGRMGHDAHWFSDVVGAALLGWCSTELLVYLHKQHAQQPSRWRIFPVSAPPTPGTSSRLSSSFGIGIAYSW